MPPLEENVVLLEVSWNTYEAILSDIGDGGNTRLAYDGRTLELMAPLNEHEANTSLIEMLLNAVMVEWDINLYCSASGTLKAKPLAAEPDTSCYIEHAAAVTGLARIELGESPPPDLVVEVDLSHQRIDKSELYAKLGVPEFWRIDRGGLRAFRLQETPYREISESVVIPGLPVDALNTFLERALDTNRLAIMKDWQAWLRAERARRSQE
jgi:Uma2 family endonuclease